MDEVLEKESQNLVQSWKNQQSQVMEEYLVTGYENPRMNMQSILTRHFFIRELFGHSFDPVMEEEIRFSVELHRAMKEEEQRQEAAAIPGMAEKPRYLRWKEMEQVIPPQQWNVFMERWSSLLKGRTAKKLKVLEVACGSANDYRFFHAYGLAPFLEYTGVDLTETNIANATRLFPGVDFRVGNALALDFPDGHFDYLVVSDLLEHLSPVALEVAAAELCRVTARKLIVHFFNMQDISQHKINPVAHYHWNWLSRSQTQQLFQRWCQKIDIIWIREFWHSRYHYPEYYNKNSHTFFMEK